MANRANNWQDKTTLLNLLITTSINGYTYNHGAVELNIDAQTLFNYLTNLVLPELTSETENLNDLPLLKATSIKFLYFFRNQIPDDQVLNIASLMAKFLPAESQVIQSYAAACLEKMLIKKSNGNPNMQVLNDNNVDSNMISLFFSNLCQLLNDNKDLYAVRALFRVIQLSKKRLIPFA